MNSDMHNFFSHMKTERLSEYERVRLREHLLLAISRQEQMPERSRFSRFSRWFGFLVVHRFAYASLVLVLLSFSGLSYAAERSLPGDVFYSLKIHVTEPIRVALSLTPASKVHVEAELALRRLAEVETLSSAGGLTDETRESLVSRAILHADTFATRLDTYEKDIDADYAVRISKQLESSLTSRVRSESSRQSGARGVARSNVTTFVTSLGTTSAMLEIEASLPSVQATGTASVHERVETEAQGEGETSVTSRLLESRRHIEETRERIEAVMKDRQEERSDRLREAKERQSDAIEELRQPDESD